MKAFTYLEPDALDDAVALLDVHGERARLIAGGQSLLLAMKERLATPGFLVSLARLPALQGWHYTDSGELEIGATTTYTTLATSEYNGWHSEIAAVAGDLADRPVRNRGTIGGAICQADPRFDMPTLLVGAGASVDTAAAGGGRTLQAGELFDPKGGTCLGVGEILTTIRIPPVVEGSSLAFEKFRFRLFDAALVSAACALRVDASSDTIAEARVVVGATSPAPRSLEASSELVGRAIDDADIAQFSVTAMDEAMPAGGASLAQQYQRELVGVLVGRALRRARDQTRN